MSTLYHYTTPAGFQGILVSRGIWATDTRFLNDRDEFKTGWDVFRQVLQSHRSRLASDYPVILERIDGALEGVDLTTAHVASFSLEGDMLSQWRGYNGGYGFSLGFSGDALNSATQAQHFQMSPVAYQKSEHYEAVHAKFELLYSLLKDPDRHANLSVVLWWLQVLRLVTVLKNEHFKEEAEYRIFAGDGADTTAVKVRATSRALIPYLQMQLDAFMPIMGPHKNLGLVEVVVGPAMGVHQQSAAELLLKQHGIDVPVRMSAIPYIGS